MAGQLHEIYSIGRSQLQKHGRHAHSIACCRSPDRTSTPSPSRSTGPRSRPSSLLGLSHSSRRRKDA